LSSTGAGAAGPEAFGAALVVSAIAAAVVVTFVLRRAARAPALQRWSRWWNPIVVMAWLAVAGSLTWRVLARTDTWSGVGGRIAVLLGLILIAAPVIRDLLAATIIGLEGRYRITDHLRVGDHEGRVVALGLRSVVLRAHDGSETAIPNRRLLESDVVRLNLTSGEAPLEFEISVPIDRLLDEVAAEIVAAALLSPLAAPGSLPEVFVTATGTEHSRLRVRAYVFDRAYEARYRSDILTRLAAREYAAATVDPPPPSAPS
jgi:small-conductance mechanosensitive channel